ncbi:MAG: ABC transporter permease [archaeon]
MNELLRIAVRNLSSQKTRTALTLLGIIIGVGAIVSLVSVGEGLQSTITDLISNLGTHRIIVSPGGGAPTMGLSFADSDVETIEKVSGVEAVTGAYASYDTIKTRRESTQALVRGVDPGKIKDVMSGAGGGFEIVDGRFLQEGDTHKIVAGWDFHESVFEKKVEVRDTIEIRGQTFEVVGVIKKLGQREADQAILVPIEDVWDLYGANGEYKLIFVKVDDSYDPEKVAETIKEKLKRKRDREDFSVLTTKQILETLGSLTRILSIVLGGIAGVSLLVGGVGIANTMLMSVLERTKEIGVMKALGAFRRQIISIFIVEATLIGVIGGAIGVVTGYGLSKGISAATAAYGIELATKVTPTLAAEGMGFAIIVSILFGTYPAYQASKLDPVQSLRY